MRLPRVFRPIRRLVAAAQGLRDALRELSGALRAFIAVQEAQGPATARLDALELSRHQWEAAVQEAQGPATARLDALELSRYQWEAMCEGLLQKAEGKLGAARNAEARERVNKKSYEHLLDPLAEIGEQPETSMGSADIVHDAPASEEERLHALRLDVAPTNKTLAQRAKFGVR